MSISSCFLIRLSAGKLKIGNLPIFQHRLYCIFLKEGTTNPEHLIIIPKVFLWRVKHRSAWTLSLELLQQGCALSLYCSVKAILYRCGTHIYLCGCHTRFLKNRGSHPFFFELFWRGLRWSPRMVFINGSSLDVATIHNYDDNDSAVSYRYMRT